jgi:hypothetical protein
MNEMRNFIEESLEIIRKRAHKNTELKGFFIALCRILKELESIAVIHLAKDDVLLKEINDLKKIICNHEQI